MRITACLILATLTLNQINVGIACITGLCGLIIALPKTIRTIRNTDWVALFTSRRRK